VTAADYVSGATGAVLAAMNADLAIIPTLSHAFMTALRANPLYHKAVVDESQWNPPNNPTASYQLNIGIWLTSASGISYELSDIDPFAGQRYFYNLSQPFNGGGVTRNCDYIYAAPSD
jgi:hypothetical protein